ncbi:GMC family oxidoreductase [Aliiroseovarius sp. S1339]|uniref:GMC oxidoreductase n=1 Tax=Aliiroseovarius sp. S1339 TaxID=2936990 RepID=UPI0020C03FE9|nr:GMC family oxidoreductase [Aliiroseovarius sp. S1339]MCK8465077.1 GMC family oxidoreductase [Aliiroseovarius sp. S1339]
MFINATDFPQGHIETARVCVFGSGPAGMTLAYDLAEAGVDVLLVEAGGEEVEDTSQALYQGTVVGDEYFDLEYARLRCFGGTSGHWGGICRPLDPFDFDENPGAPGTGWPIAADALAPYLNVAADILEIPAKFDDQALNDTLRRTDFEYSPPVRFGEKYLPYVEGHENLRVVLNTALTNLTSDADRIRSATVQTAQAGEWTIEADYFVLCAGGIENSRLLLWINDQNDQKIIKNHDIVGRYWIEHFTMTVAEVIADAEALGTDENDQAHFSLSHDFQKENGVLNASFEVNPSAYSGTKALIADLLCIAPKLGERLMGDKGLVCGSRVIGHWEQAPSPDNRVALGNEKDALGIPKVELHWQRTGIDRKTIARSVHALAQQFADLDIGRVRLFDWVQDDTLPLPADGVIASWHHMGGTRMSEDAQTGVVNANLKVHDQSNLYVAGSSVFPSGGMANPTLTIVQLSLRLADHLKGQMGV